MGNKGFKDLAVWQKAKDLAVRMYHISGNGALGRDFGLRDQIRRSSVSVASNLAEGDERGSEKDSIRFFYFAKGSVAELRTQVQIACDVGYLKKPLFDSLETECELPGKMIGSLIRARQRSPHP